MAKTQKIRIDVTPREIMSAYVAAPFDEGKKALEEQGYNVISLEENAKLRIQEGKDSNIPYNSNWTREGVVYIPKKGIFLTKNSPIMENPKKATEFHKNEKDFYLNNEQVEKSLADCVEIKNNQNLEGKFCSDEVLVYAFGGETNARNYIAFLEKNKNIRQIPIWLANMQDKPFATQVMLKDLANWSGLNCSIIGLQGFHFLRGTYDYTKNTLEKFGFYTPKQISSALEKANLSGIEKTLIENLKQ